MNLYYSEILQVIEDKEKIKKCIYKLMRQSELLEKSSKNNVLEINGIPETKHENVLNIVRKMNRFVSADTDPYDVLTCERVCRRLPRPIITKVRNRRIRDKIIAAVRLYNETHPKENLNSYDLDYDGYISPVLVSIYPSPLNKIHREQARKIARENGVISPKCTVCVAKQKVVKPKPPKPDRKVRIRTTHSLRSLSLSILNADYSH